MRYAHSAHNSAILQTERCIFRGAGISVSAGIPSFRGKEGLFVSDNSFGEEFNNVKIESLFRSSALNVSVINTTNVSSTSYALLITNKISP
jgi:NAD-dependent SIR2 family protein deacetylase